MIQKSGTNVKRNMCAIVFGFIAFASWGCTLLIWWKIMSTLQSSENYASSTRMDRLQLFIKQQQTKLNVYPNTIVIPHSSTKRHTHQFSSISRNQLHSSNIDERNVSHTNSIHVGHNHHHASSKSNTHPQNQIQIAPNKCPDVFPNQKQLSLKKLRNVCSHLRDFKIHGNCDIKNCSKCMPPNSKSMPWTDNDVVPYLDAYDSTETQRHNKLQSLLSHINPNDSKPIVLIVFNYGYSYLFFNWACSIEYNQLDIDHEIRNRTVVITTDFKAKSMLESKGFLVYYPEWLGTWILKHIDEKASERFANGPHRWIVSIQIATLNDLVQLGYNVILQDSDIVWNKNPITYLTQPDMQNIDIQVKLMSYPHLFCFYILQYGFEIVYV